MRKTSPLNARRARRSALLACGALALSLTLACDDAGGPAVASGTVTVAPEQGVAFATGSLVEDANFANTDIFATRNGAAIKLSTGGANATENRPINWFKTSGGVFQTFQGLEDVPTDRPDPDMTASLVRAQTGNGFVVLTMDGRYARGWLSQADGDSVTISFGPVPAEADADAE